MTRLSGRDSCIIGAAGLLAGIWWGGAAALIAGMSLFETGSVVVVSGAVALGLVPGLGMIFAGWLGAQVSRTVNANETLLNAANGLLQPADESAAKAVTLAEKMSVVVNSLNSDIESIEANVVNLSGDLTQSAGLLSRTARVVKTNGTAVVEGLNGHVETLAETSKTLAEQTAFMEDAVGRHASSVTAAAEEAKGEIQRAEDTLNARVASMDDAAERLATIVAEIDRLAKDGRKRSMALTYALERVSQQMDTSSENVDAALKAGEMAIAASKTTADALAAAVAEALDKAMTVSKTIESQSTEAHRDAEATLARIARAKTSLESSTEFSGNPYDALPTPMATNRTVPDFKIVRSDGAGKKTSRAKIALDDVFGADKPLSA
ncbi:MAG: hypothetical protein AAFW65_05700 [Pseudomonadota bacterium]